MNTSDFVLAKALIEDDILEELRPDWIQQKAPSGAVLITCGDRDRFNGFFHGCTSIVPVHPIVLNGGGILLGEGVDETRQAIILEDCQAALDMKTMDFVFTLSHFPCGKAGTLHLGLQDIIKKTLQGKKYLKKHLGQKIRGVLPIISIDWRDASIENEDGIKLYAAHISKAALIAAYTLPQPAMHDDYAPNHKNMAIAA